MPDLEVKLFSSDALIPNAATSESAGLDLYSAVNLTIKSKKYALVDTHVGIKCPPGTYGRIAGRSGLALKHGIIVGAGVIDADYTGPISALLFNMGEDDFVVNKGDRIAQLILENHTIATLKIVDSLSSQRASKRQQAGFGSSGISGDPTNLKAIKFFSSPQQQQEEPFRLLKAASKPKFIGPNGEEWTVLDDDYEGKNILTIHLNPFASRNQAAIEKNKEAAFPRFGSSKPSIFN